MEDKKYITIEQHEQVLQLLEVLHNQIQIVNEKVNDLYMQLAFIKSYERGKKL